MAYKITDDCINCGGCVEICQNQAIIEEETITVIDPSKCTECVGIYETPMCGDVCSVDAVKPDPEHQETRDELLEKWRRLHPGETPKTR
jgi:ferredoxin